MNESTNQPPKKHRWYYYPGVVLLILVLLLGCLLGYMTVTEYRPAPVEEAVAGGADLDAVFPGNALRVMTFNTGYGGLGKESDFVMDGGKGSGATDIQTVQKNLDGIRALLLEAQADVYMLQEVDLDSSRTFRTDEAAYYSQALSGYERYFAPNYICNLVPYPLQNPIWKVHSGVATYSRFDISSAQRHSLPVPFPWPLRTANLKRCLLVSRMPIENSNKEVVFINLHLEAYDDGEGKTAQTKQLLSLLDEEAAKGNYVIAGGDFNQIFPEVVTDLKETSQWVPGDLEPLPGDWRYVYDDTTPTCRLLNQPYDPESPLTQYYVIDGFILSPNVQVQRIQTVDQHFEFSDHNPVILDLILS